MADEEVTLTIVGPEPAGDGPTFSQQLAAEMLGTFILVLFGCGAAVFAAIYAVIHRESAPDVSYITTVGLAFGIGVTVALLCFERISGGHFNPAVTFASAVAGRISWLVAAGYAAAQVIGGIAAACVIWIVAHGYDGYSSSHFTIAQNGYGDSATTVGYAWWGAFVLEVVLTGVLVTVVLACTDARNRFRVAAPVAVGLTLAAAYFIAIPADGGSFNPARSIGPALFADNRAVGQLWLFILAPLVGGLIAGVAYPLIFGEDREPVPGSGLSLLARRRSPEPTYPWEEFAAHPDNPGEPPVIIQDGWRWDYATQQWVPDEPQSPADTPTV